MKRVSLSLSQALDYSVGRVLTATRKAKGRRKASINFAQWPEMAASLRSAVERTSPENARKVFSKRVSWSEPKDDHLECAIAAADAAVSAVHAHWVKHHTDCEACDRVAAAVEDAQTSIRDLRAALEK